MPRYKVRAYTEGGELIEDVMEAPSVNDLVEKVREKGYHFINAEEISEAKEVKREAVPKKGRLTFLQRVGDRDLSLFCRQLGAMVNAGVGIIDALDIVADQMPNKKLARATAEVSRDVSEGMSLSSAMTKRKDVFPELVINLVSVGEETGELDTALMRASEYYEKIAMIKSKIKSASFYPTFVLVIATVIVTGILYFLVPTFAEIYEGFGASLPLPTQVLINISNALRENILFFVLFVVAFVFAFRYAYTRSYAFKKSVHRLMLRLPLFGDLVAKSAMAKFSRTMATLFASGVSIERALEIAGKVTGNVIIREAVDKVQKEVTEGQTMWSSMEKTGQFPKLVVAMVKVGEETGRLDEMLDTIARFYEDEVDRTVEGLITLIEPMLIVILGIIVGGILIALYLPIFKLGELIK
ncbi:MAG: type II secretion system F family protein [Aquificota bacterium]|nr:type II secretion system F family protein [Aquificota bacterium]